MRTSIRGEEARLDISARGFLGGWFKQAFFEVWVFNPSAPTNRSLQLTASYRTHEQEKRRSYEQHVREGERAPSFHWYLQQMLEWARQPLFSY